MKVKMNLYLDKELRDRVIRAANEEGEPVEEYIEGLLVEDMDARDESKEIP